MLEYLKTALGKPTPLEKRFSSLQPRHHNKTRPHINLRFRVADNVGGTGRAHSPHATQVSCLMWALGTTLSVCGPKEGYRHLHKLDLDGAVRARLLARAAAAAPLFVDFRQHPLLFVVKPHLAHGPEHLARLPSGWAWVADEADVVSLPAPFRRRPPQLRLRPVSREEFSTATAAA